MSSSATKAVARGAAWLDKTVPGWERKIDFATLDMTYNCICDQAVEGGWSTVLDMMQEEFGPCSGEASNHGFTPQTDAWEATRPQWEALVKERFNTGALSDLVVI